METKLWALDMPKKSKKSSSTNITNIDNVLVENNKKVLGKTYKKPQFTQLNKENYGNTYENIYNITYKPIYDP
jgi:hypothetical protein